MVGAFDVYNLLQYEVTKVALRVGHPCMGLFSFLSLLSTTRVVAVVEASEICQSSFDHELGASRHHNREERRR